MGQGRSGGMSSVKIDITALLSRAFVYKFFMDFSANHFWQVVKLNLGCFPTAELVNR